MYIFNNKVGCKICYCKKLNNKKIQLSIFFTDENNPEDQAYNVTTLSEQKHVVNIGNTIEIQVIGSGTKKDCIVATPSGAQVNPETDVSPKSVVKFVDTENWECTVSIGPISEDMLGSWQLSGKFNERGAFNEFRRPFNIIKEGMYFLGGSMEVRISWGGSRAC